MKIGMDQKSALSLAPVALRQKHDMRIFEAVDVALPSDTDFVNWFVKLIDVVCPEGGKLGGDHLLKRLRLDCKGLEGIKLEWCKSAIKIIEDAQREIVNRLHYKRRKGREIHTIGWLLNLKAGELKRQLYFKIDAKLSAKTGLDHFFRGVYFFVLSLVHVSEKMRKEKQLKKEFKPKVSPLPTERV